MFLFGARDVWFVVGIPVYFYSILSDGTPDGRRAAFFLVGSFMALWIIGYGAVQAAAPQILRASTKPIPEIIGLARLLGRRPGADPGRLSRCWRSARAPAHRPSGSPA